MIVGICGGTGSGKTFLAERLARALGAEVAVRVEQDWYYRPAEAGTTAEERLRRNYDVPEALDNDRLVRDLTALRGPVETRALRPSPGPSLEGRGVGAGTLGVPTETRALRPSPGPSLGGRGVQSGTPEQGHAIQAPKYSFEVCDRVPGYHAVPWRPVVIVEGILIFAREALRKVFDLKVFVEADEEVRIGRRLERDVAQRGRDRQEVLRRYAEQVREAYTLYIEPYRCEADVVVHNNRNDQGLPAEFDTLVEWIRARHALKATE